MKKTVNFNDFENAFENMNRADQFTSTGLRALFDYLEQFEEETGNEVELDVIALCCEFTEYENIEEYNNNYNTEYKNMEDIYETFYIPIDSESFIIQD